MWESEEAIERFFAERLGPAMAQVGVSHAGSKRTVFELHTLVAGDLNTFGPVRPHLWKRISAAAEAAGLVNLTSSIHHTHWTGQKLDAIYASSHVPFSSRAWTVDARASDHLPVFADIEPKAA